jgi:predicted nucleic acid-binding protein
MKNYEIIVDSNIVQYLGNKHLANTIADYLSSYSDIFYSEISLGELTAGARREEIEEKMRIVSQMKPIPIEQSMLFLSGQLHTIYTKAKIPYQHISLADRIIAASAISRNATIYTADVNDFPRPFFQETDEHVISYQYKNKSRFLVTQVLKPNYPVITEHINSV